ncbi:hypothetical protein PV10_07535 [Exophiala mesophila]|uniref:Homeobox domain-containing protein n=1 Tax=Exophiala mesophila TaxID=212818 RepID=A0A0D1WMF7_EXOME|nr:uncharacterized protein PV10_07535 [Exophiala mesophila]KIV90205.1 hypothetical protein PV10_07535 [Exophiala mesophila]
MSTRSMDPYYESRHHRQTSSWAPSQYSDMLQSYEPQPRPQYASLPQLTPSRPNSSLPPLRDLTIGPDPNYPPPAGIYSHSYAPSGSTSTSIESGSYPNDRAYYETNQRYGQDHPPTNRPQPPPVSPDYYRYPSGTIPYQAPSYGSIDYSNGSLISPHPSSPSITDADSRNRRRRGNLPKPITDILRTWFHDHLDHPYPTEEDKQAFVSQTGLTMNQVSNWFINARRRQLPALRQARDRVAQPATADYDSDQLHRAHHHHHLHRHH